MLEELSIRNYALIDSLSLSFDGGLNILTGETGAGKSIIVGALSFIMGARMDAEVIRTGAEEAGVSVVVSLKADNRDAADWLAGRDIEAEDGRLVIRRTIRTSGRGAMYIQHVPVTRNDLTEFMSLLFDLHGQHNHESLLRKETHRKYLDHFAGIEEEVAGFNRIFLDLAEKKQSLDASLRSDRDRELRLEMLSYAVEEINRAAPRNGEGRELEAEAARLGDFEKLAGFVNTAAAALSEDEHSLLSLARRVRSALESAVAVDTGLEALRQRMEDLYYEAEDLSEEFRAYRENLVYDPERLEEVEERLSLLYRLKKKYLAATASPETMLSGEDAILAYRDQAAAEIEALSGAEENRDKLKAGIAALEKDIAVRAASISARRLAGAQKLGERIRGIVAGLGMPKARFSVAVTPKRRTAGGDGTGNAGGLLVGPWGTDDVEFLISANVGEPLKELSRIASGGELSRVMLAIKTALAGGDAPGSSDSHETLIFDEIDTGIGGEVALAVGEYLASIGKTKQIFCVTHLASIAVRADNHLKVEKRNDGARTLTFVSVLGADGRREEIARMLAGDSAGNAALAHADELLAKYGKRR
ncbi:MAG: DNA repair protein RecN [Spirochaetaceae bacterium]|jgi:DNA repair protein RecN (Recombination protein N)|nr:DNA repair protein RecN [Spirochaetaceae bacterium]